MEYFLKDGKFFERWIFFLDEKLLLGDANGSDTNIPILLPVPPIRNGADWTHLAETPNPTTTNCLFFFLFKKERKKERKSFLKRHYKFNRRLNRVSLNKSSCHFVDRFGRRRLQSIGHTKTRLLPPPAPAVSDKKKKRKKELPLFSHERAPSLSNFQWMKRERTNQLL